MKRIDKGPPVCCQCPQSCNKSQEVAGSRGDAGLWRRPLCWKVKPPGLLAGPRSPCSVLSCPAPACTPPRASTSLSVCPRAPHPPARPHVPGPPSCRAWLWAWFLVPDALGAERPWGLRPGASLSVLGSGLPQGLRRGCQLWEPPWSIVGALLTWLACILCGPRDQLLSSKLKQTSVNETGLKTCELVEWTSKESRSSFGVRSAAHYSLLPFQPQPARRAGPSRGRESRACWAESAQPPPPWAETGLARVTGVQEGSGGHSCVCEEHRGHRCVCEGHRDHNCVCDGSRGHKCVCEGHGGHRCVCEGHGGHNCVLLKPGLENFELYFTRGCDECNCVVV